MSAWSNTWFAFLTAALLSGAGVVESPAASTFVVAVQTDRGIPLPIEADVFGKSALFAFANSELQDQSFLPATVSNTEVFTSVPQDGCAALSVQVDDGEDLRDRDSNHIVFIVESHIEFQTKSFAFRDECYLSDVAGDIVKIELDEWLSGPDLQPLCLNHQTALPKQRGSVENLYKVTALLAQHSSLELDISPNPQRPAAVYSLNYGFHADGGVVIGEGVPLAIGDGRSDILTGTTSTDALAVFGKRDTVINGTAQGNVCDVLRVANVDYGNFAQLTVIAGLNRDKRLWLFQKALSSEFNTTVIRGRRRVAFFRSVLSTRTYGACSTQEKWVQEKTLSLAEVRSGSNPGNGDRV